MYCNKCGKKLPENSKFCSTCGTELILKDTISTDTELRKNKNIIKKVVLTGAVVIIIILIVLIKHYTKGEVQLIGRWDVNKYVSQGEIGYYTRSGDVVEFCKDGTFLSNADEGYYYVLSNEKLIIEINGEKYTCKYNMEWNWNGKHELILKAKGKKLTLVKIKK